MRRILRKIAEDEFGALGDTSTLADPAVVDDLVENRQNKRIGVDAHDVGEPHAGFGQDRRDVGEAQIGLGASAFGDGAVCGNAQLARAEYQPMTYRHLDAMAVAGEGRTDRGGREGFHGVLRAVLAIMHRQPQRNQIMRGGFANRRALS
jgi:hypothetical protein